MEDDDDLEALRLAALQTIKPRKADRRNTNLQYHYYRQKANPNLIEIVTKDELFETPAIESDIKSTELSNDKTIEKGVVGNNTDKCQNQEEKKIRSKFRTEDENADEKNLKLDEDQLDFEYESDFQIYDDDSLEKLMDEMEQEFNEKPSIVSTLKDKNIIRGMDSKVKKQLSKSGSPVDKKHPLTVKSRNVSSKTCPSSKLQKLTRRSITPQDRHRKSVSPVVKRLAGSKRKSTVPFRSRELRSTSRSRSPTPNLRSSLRSGRSTNSRPRRSYSPKVRKLSPNTKSRMPSEIEKRKRSLTPKRRKSESPHRTLNDTAKNNYPLTGKSKSSIVYLRSTLKSLDSHTSPPLSPCRKKARSPNYRSCSRSPVMNEHHKARRSTSPKRRLIKTRSHAYRKRSESPAIKRTKTIIQDSSTLEYSKKGKSTHSSAVQDIEKEENGCDQNIISDSKLEARRKKFESNTVVAPVNKKIRLNFSSGDKNENNKSQKNFVDEQPVATIKNLTKSRVLSEARIIDEDEPTNKNLSSKVDLKRTDLQPITMMKEIVIKDECFEKNSSKESMKELIFSKNKNMDKVKTKGKQLALQKMELDKHRKQGNNFHSDSKDSLVLNVPSNSEKKSVTKLSTNQPDNDNESDLRDELSRRRAERLRESSFQPAARIIKSAFEGVVNSKEKIRKQMFAEQNSSKKISSLKGRRVHVVDKSRDASDDVGDEKLYEQTSKKLTTLNTRALIRQKKINE
ncbi:serine/arginine repetitive matrix protein 1-like [Cimex lectularius]|uniref:Uncharacterized protein n=1 Tax=Cimex lectularius TaxID=79782 RepID=A0A8I6SDB1_CIMLE|nr:serine/arginine repetitive matrix protein 1-like [Cimex lectularius]